MTISNERLAQGLKAMAEIVLEDPRYLPLYERLEQEVMARQAKNDVLARVRMVARGGHHPVLLPEHHR